MILLSLETKISQTGPQGLCGVFSNHDLQFLCPIGQAAGVPEHPLLLGSSSTSSAALLPSPTILFSEKGFGVQFTLRNCCVASLSCK